MDDKRTMECLRASGLPFLLVGLRAVIRKDESRLFEDVEPLASGFATAVRRTRDVILTDALLEVTVKARKGEPQIAAVEVQLLGR